MSDESDEPGPVSPPRGLLAFGLSLLALAAVGAIGLGTGRLEIVDGLMLAIPGVVAGSLITYAWFKYRRLLENGTDSESSSSLESHANREPLALTSWTSRILTSPRFTLLALILGLPVLVLAIYYVSAYPSMRNIVSLIVVAAFIALFSVLTIRRWQR